MRHVWLVLAIIVAAFAVWLAIDPIDAGATNAPVPTPTGTSRECTPKPPQSTPTNTLWSPTQAPTDTELPSGAISATLTAMSPLTTPWVAPTPTDTPQPPTPEATQMIITQTAINTSTPEATTPRPACQPSYSGRVVNVFRQADVTCRIEGPDGIPIDQAYIATACKCDTDLAEWHTFRARVWEIWTACDGSEFLVSREHTDYSIIWTGKYCSLEGC
jgi:hypothetical protein